MALNLMGAEYVPETAIAVGSHFAGDFGASVYNPAKFQTVILGKNPDGSYLAHVDVIGTHAGTGGSTTEFKWANVDKIWAEAMTLTGANKAKLLAGGVIPFYYQTFINDVGYGPGIVLGDDNNYLTVGRIYDTSGNFGGLPMATLVNGIYAFGVYVLLWNE